MSVLSDISAFLNILKSLGEFSPNKDIFGRFRGKNFFHNNFNKKTYIDEEGNGVVVVSFDVVVLDPITTDSISLSLNISDSKDCCGFPSFDKMCDDSLIPFKDYRFSYYSSDNIIQKVEENYDSFPNAERRSLEKNDKFIGLKFVLDKHSLKKNGVYHISYMFSIPGMFPIVNGYFGGVSEKVSISSDMECNTNYKNAKVSLYLSTLINLDGDIKPDLTSSGNVHSNKIKVTKEHSMIYNKYIVRLKHAYKYKYFGFVWDVKDINSNSNLQGVNLVHASGGE